MQLRVLWSESPLEALLSQVPSVPDEPLSPQTSQEQSVWQPSEVRRRWLEPLAPWMGHILIEPVSVRLRGHFLLY